MQRIYLCPTLPWLRSTREAAVRTSAPISLPWARDKDTALALSQGHRGPSPPAGLVFQVSQRLSTQPIQLLLLKCSPSCEARGLWLTGSLTVKAIPLIPSLLLLSPLPHRSSCLSTLVCQREGLEEMPGTEMVLGNSKGREASMSKHSVVSTFGENGPSPVALLQTLSCNTLCQLTLRTLV